MSITLTEYIVCCAGISSDNVFDGVRRLNSTSSSKWGPTRISEHQQQQQQRVQTPEGHIRNIDSASLQQYMIQQQAAAKSAQYSRHAKAFNQGVPSQDSSVYDNESVDSYRYGVTERIVRPIKVVPPVKDLKEGRKNQMGNG